MNALTRLQFNLREASTKRGLAMFAAGSAALYHLAFGAGDAPDLDAILARADFWLSVGAQLSGLIGMFFADEPKNVHIEQPLPSSPSATLRGRERGHRSPSDASASLSNQGRSPSEVEGDRAAPAPEPPHRLRPGLLDVPPGHRTRPDLDERRPAAGFNDQ